MPCLGRGASRKLYSDRWRLLVIPVIPRSDPDQILIPLLALSSPRMNESLYSEIVDLLLEDDEKPPEEKKKLKFDARVMALVDAACHGPSQLETALSGLAEGSDVALEPVAKSEKPKPPGIYIQQIKAAGFRGVGPAATLQLPPGPGLTLVVGRNGSGKSSFADALELSLTGKCARWEERSADWREGWRNLHHGDAVEIGAVLLVEDGPSVGLSRTWKKEAGLGESKLSVRRGGEKYESLEALGWGEAVKTFRPFLSYAELSVLVKSPSQLFDSLKSILGVGELVQAVGYLGEAKKQRDRARKAVAQRLKDELRPGLEALAASDERAKSCLALLKTSKAKNWDLEGLAQVVTGGQAEGPSEALRAIQKLQGPDLEGIDGAVKELRQAMAGREALAGSNEAMNAALAKVLSRAIGFHEQHGGDCPVCEGPLDSQWSERARVRLDQAAELAKRVRAAEQTVTSCTQALRRLIRPPAAALESATELALPARAGELWKAWGQAPQEPGALCDHAEQGAGPLWEAIEELRAAAARRLAELDTQWTPLATAIAQWLPDARAVKAQGDVLTSLKQAEAWLKGAESIIQARRFEPLAARARELWNMLRQQSNVNLDNVVLAGQKNRRHVALDVNVDGESGVALGVMSQGELNALSLSLFLPRMTLPASPFHFMAIDDPVQAMDPHKVDGLARVLEDVAKTRQVIIFTHDTRLQEAVRRLKIDATVLEVQRQTNSRVSATACDDAVTRYLHDAKVVADSMNQLGTKLVRRCVPGHCRGAIEAACLETIRRRRLGRGDPHAQVRSDIESSRTLTQIMALALFDDREAGSKVMAEVNRKINSAAGDAVRSCKEGVHGNFDGDPFALINATRKITEHVRRLA